jgi:hypothetical protein
MERMCATLVYAAMKRSGEIPGGKRESALMSWIRKIQAVADAVLNLAALIAGGMLGYAGITFDNAPLASSALLTVGILLVFMVLVRIFDRRK